LSASSPHSLSLHDALPISSSTCEPRLVAAVSLLHDRRDRFGGQIPSDQECVRIVERGRAQKLPEGDLGPVEIGGEEESFELALRDRKSTRLNSSHVSISYA